MSKMTNMCAVLVLQALLSVACGNKGNVSSDKYSIEIYPAELSCAAPKTELPLTIKASGSFQVFAADDCDWARVNPSFSRESTATVVVSVDDNAAYKERSTDITVKCGSLRKKVRLTQAAMEKGEIDIDVPEGYSLVWNDEFESGIVPDTKNWWYETGASGWGNNELQNYVVCSQDGVDLASISGGTLKIKAQKIGGTVYSIRMNTKKYWTYGWFEARLKVTDVAGAWPAFWMMPQNFKTWPGDGEVDIMEYAISTQGKDRVSSSIHCNKYNHTIGTGRTHVQSISNAAGEFHVYACEWTADGFRFYVDGKLHHTFANDGTGNYDTWPFFNPFYLKLNLAWGGNMGGRTDESGLPAVYEIDYVRVFQK